MATYQWWVARVTPSTSAVRFANVIGLFQAGNATEGQINAPCGAGNAVEIRVKATVAPGSGKRWQVQLSKNGSPSATLDTSISDLNTEAAVIGTVAISAGDLIVLKITPSGTPAACDLEIWTRFSPTTDNWFCYPSCDDSSTGLSTRRGGLCNGYTSAPTTDSAARRTPMPMAGTLRELYYALDSTPTGAGTWTLTASPYGRSVAIANPATAGSLTGLSDAVAVGDRAQAQFTLASSPGARRQKWCAVIESTDPNRFLLAGSNGAMDSAATDYEALGSAGTIISASESAVQITALADLSATAMAATFAAAPGSSPKQRDLYLRIAGASGNLHAVLSAASVDSNDTAHTDSISRGQLINLMQVPTSSPTGSSANAWAIALEYAAILNYEQTGAGGVVFGGSAHIAIGYAQTGAGGVVFGGIPPLISTSEYEGEGGIVFGGSALVQMRTPSKAGPALAFISRPDFSEPAGAAGGMRVLSYRVNRYANRIGTWEAVLAVDDQPAEGIPLHSQIRKGWHLSLVHEGSQPPSGDGSDWLVYMGEVQQREYQAAGATGGLLLSGSLRSMHLAERSVNKGLAFQATPYSVVFEQLAGGDSYIGPNGGIEYPEAYALKTLSATFNELSRYAVLSKVAELGRLTLRDSWQYDRPELVNIDNPPFSGYVLTRVESWSAGLESAARAGYALINARPLVRYEGGQIVNKIVAVGSDTPEGELTLGYSTQSSPYVVKVGENPDGSDYHYIEDVESQAAYGLAELKLRRSDVKNPSDNAGTRRAAADVLYAVTVNELLRRKAEIVQVQVSVANGADVWALPGDSIRLRYQGAIETESGAVLWMDENRLYLVVERVDQSSASGVRSVAFGLAAPEITIPVPGLPGAVSLPVLGTGPVNPRGGLGDGGGLGGLGGLDGIGGAGGLGGIGGLGGLDSLPGLDGLSGLDFGLNPFNTHFPGMLDAPIPGCCEDPTTSINDGAIPPLSEPGPNDTTGTPEQPNQGDGGGEDRGTPSGPTTYDVVVSLGEGASYGYSCEADDWQATTWSLAVKLEVYEDAGLSSLVYEDGYSTVVTRTLTLNPGHYWLVARGNDGSVSEPWELVVS